MTQHDNDSIVDKIKDALGMGTDDDHVATDAALDADRPEGWAGVDDALGGTANRPAGPDYAEGDQPLDPVRAGEGWAGGSSRGDGRPYDANTDLDVDPDVAGTTRREEDL
ncbi:MAG TPA: hypothetical protein VHQ42_01225 [Candidatus Limnocylindria bacterium]|nr:hypothetical protein [Candidatus Limnocylindria bacterium]